MCYEYNKEKWSCWNIDNIWDVLKEKVLKLKVRMHNSEMYLHINLNLSYKKPKSLNIKLILKTVYF